MQVKRTKYNTRSKLRWGIVGIFVLLLLAISFDVPKYFNKVVDKVNNTTSLGLPRIPEKNFNLGLDLQGGAELVYRADVSKIKMSDQTVSVEGVRDIIERRINGLGVSEPIIQTTKVGSDYRIIVDLPGVTDINTAIKMIGETPILEFKEQNNIPPRSLTLEEKKQLDLYNVNAKKKAQEVLQKASAGQDFSALVKEYSDDTQSKNNNGYLNYVGKYSAYPEFYNWATSSKVGEISKTLVSSTEGYNILKRGAEKPGENEITASHILICYLGSKGCDQATLTRDQAFKKAQDLYNQANANNFADLAKANSDDLSNKNNGGDLGTFMPQMMVKEFSDALSKAKVGEIIGPVETQFGYHIIYKKAEQPTQTYELWRILIKTETETDILPPQSPWKDTGLSGKQLQRSEVVTDQQTGAVQVSMQFNTEGTQLFSDITTRNAGKPVAIFLDGTVISAPRVNEPIRNGQAVITGGFNLNEAKLLAQRLNAGALPVPVELISQQNVGATLGSESLAKSLGAAIIGTIIVMLFMIFFYRLPGFLAVIALTVYVALSLAVTKFIGVTLTLSGIAGFIMSIGIAIDANVLIFERLKEELRWGKSLKAAAEEGFLRAWPSIRDSNVSTLITCVMLIWFGSSFVQGFALTLAVGILVSMFTAITVTRVMVRFIVPWFPEFGNKLFLGYTQPKTEEVKK